MNINENNFSTTKKYNKINTMQNPTNLPSKQLFHSNARVNFDPHDQKSVQKQTPSVLSYFVDRLFKLFHKETNSDKLRNYSFQISRKFEATSFATLQTKDDGIISYGIHQATLRSGTLERIVKEYIKTSSSPHSKELANYLTKIGQKDSDLKYDKYFLELLRVAAEEKEMQNAQIKVFTEKYWIPAYNKASELGLKSKIAFAIFYDTNIQGGLDQIIKNTKDSLLGQNFSEKEFLIKFLAERRKYLLNVAKRKDGIQSKMLENSAYSRVGSLISMLNKAY